jgi:hypothetical protein
MPRARRRRRVAGREAGPTPAPLIEFLPPSGGGVTINLGASSSFSRPWVAGVYD